MSDSRSDSNTARRKRTNRRPLENRGAKITKGSLEPGINSAHFEDTGILEVLNTRFSGNSPSSGE